MSASRLRTPLAGAFFAILALWASCAQAQSLKLTKLVVDNHDGRATVRFGVDVADVAALRSQFGQTPMLVLECTATLSQKRDYSWNRDISKTALKGTVSRDDDGKGYVVVMANRPKEHIRGRDLAVVVKEAWGDLAVDVGPWNLLARGERYAVTLELRLTRPNDGGWTGKALSFWSADAATPARYQLDFSY